MSTLIIISIIIVGIAIILWGLLGAVWFEPSDLLSYKTYAWITMALGVVILLGLGLMVGLMYFMGRTSSSVDSADSGPGWLRSRYDMLRGKYDAWDPRNKQALAKCNSELIALQLEKAQRESRSTIDEF